MEDLSIDRLEYFMSQNVEFLGDVTFLVGPEREAVRAFKFILIKSSPVFQAMLSDKWVQLCPGQISLPLDDPKAFRLFLWLLGHSELKSSSHLRKLGLSTNEGLDLWLICKKYAVSSLEGTCRKFLYEVLDHEAEDSILIFDNVRGSDEEQLEKVTLQFIRGNLNDLIDSDRFLELSMESLTLILSDGDNLAMDDLKLFQGLYRWGHHQCTVLGELPTGENIRKKLGSNLYEIRFHLIPPLNFTESILPTNILTREEIEFFQLEIQMAAMNLSEPPKSSSDLRSDSIEQFSKKLKPRNFVGEIMSTCTNHPIHYNQDLYLTRFVVNHKVALYSFGFVGRHEDTREYKAIVMVTPENGLFVSSLWTSGRRRSTFHVHLQQPLILEANTSCTLRYFFRVTGQSGIEYGSKSDESSCKCGKFQESFTRESQNGIKFKFFAFSPGPLCELRYTKIHDPLISITPPIRHVTETAI